MNKTKPFKLHASFKPAGDQPMAIKALTNGIKQNKPFQTLLGVTGSGKTFTLANAIQQIQKPVLIISHNKTLAAQLYSEFKAFFPQNAVEYFVSYYDYYQPEAYIPQTDTYIAKDSSINDELEKLRLSASSSLITRKDVIVVSSVSCLYGLGSPEDFAAMSTSITLDKQTERDSILRNLIDIQYKRNDLAPERGSFRATGDTVDIYPSYTDHYIRIELFGDTIEKITCRNPLTNQIIEQLNQITIFPAKHFVIPLERIKAAAKPIREELKKQVRKFELAGKIVEAQRLHQRTTYDLEMMHELGYCQGIENYSRHLSGLPPGSRPFSLVDYFPKNFITIIDESHATIPQIRAMYNADRSRKQTLIDNGFRLPSALDNRPVSFEEFISLQNNLIFVSATPSDYELSITTPIQQIIRPTGLLDPTVTVRPLENQIDDVINEIQNATAQKQRTLVTTLTKRTAEDLAEYLHKLNIKARYLHSEIDAIERIDIIKQLREGKFNCLVGINLLREGLDLPEVALVAILDADKEGFLRSTRSLIQTAGRAARHINGRVILYADKITNSMNQMITLTTTRRQQQQQYNQKNKITPKSITRPAQTSLHTYDKIEEKIFQTLNEPQSPYNLDNKIKKLETEMHKAAKQLEFERAAMLRDQIKKLKQTP